MCYKNEYISHQPHFAIVCYTASLFYHNFRPYSWFIHRQKSDNHQSAVSPDPVPDTRRDNTLAPKPHHMCVTPSAHQNTQFAGSTASAAATVADMQVQVWAGKDILAQQAAAMLS